MSEVSKSPVQAIAEALVGLCEDNGELVEGRHPFREQLQRLLPWYDAFLRRVERLVEGVIEAQPRSVSAHLHPGHACCRSFTQQRFNPLDMPQSPAAPAEHDGSAHADLVKKCPACFGRRKWGGDANKYVFSTGTEQQDLHPF